MASRDNRDMNRTATIPGAEVALNAQGEVPDWVQLLPAGPEIAGRDGRAWRLDDPERVVAAFAANGADLPVDFEHATELRGPKGEPAPAVGWIAEMATRAGAVWARVAWTDAGREALASRAYRYLSPVFRFQPESRQIAEMLSAGLTNQPNLRLAALNREDQQPQEIPMLPAALCRALDLAPEASEDAVLRKIEGLAAELVAARNAAEHPPLDRFVPRADHDQAKARLAELEADAHARNAAEIEGAVDAAIADGKTSPATRDYHIAACKAEGGLDRFRSWIATAPTLTAPTGLGGKAPAAGPMALTDDERAACRAAGWSEASFLAAKAAEKKEA